MIHTGLRACFAVSILPWLIAGCGLPTSGPRGEAVRLSAEVHVEPKRGDKPLPYCLVTVSSDVVTAVAANQPRLAGRFADRRGPVSVRLGVGDVLGVTIYESGVGGLFFPLEGGLRQGNFITLPNQEVDNAGNISIPYAGSIRAGGRTVVQVQNAIVDALKGRALDPQAVVTVIEQRASLITVLGEVGGPTRFRASASGERILDAITRAGGPKNQGQETWVLLERKGRIAAAPFEALIREPANNIYVQANDTIYLFKEPQTFIAFGATGQQGQFNFDSWRLTVAQAMAKSGGLRDTQAEPSWVYLYRSENRKTVEAIDPKCRVTDGKVVPVIYQFDLREPSAYFLTTHFPMRDKDVIYVANAKSVEVNKFMDYVRAVSSTISSPMQTTITGYALKEAIQGASSGSSLIIGNTGTAAPAPP